jgi:hypothetical protein
MGISVLAGCRKQGVSETTLTTPPPGNTSMSEIRKWHVDQALHSVRSMMKVINEMTVPELEAALELESATRRRDKIVQRLIGRAAHLHGQEYVNQLKKRLNHGT